MEKNILTIDNRSAFRDWLMQNASVEEECWLDVKKGKPVDPDIFYYLDAVEEALCFGWIDSAYKMIGAKRMQRFSPRRKNSPWTELNKERVRRLEKLGMMTDAGRAVLPEMDVTKFVVDEEIKTAMQLADCWVEFESFPPLYKRIRLYNVAFYQKRNPETYKKALQNLIEKTKKGQMYGEWNDYGRLLNY